MVAVAEYANASEALSDAALLATHGFEAVLSPDPGDNPSPPPPFRLLTAEAAVHDALQVLLQQALADDPTANTCPQCRAPGLRISSARRLFAVVELALGSQLAPARPSCPNCGWSPADPAQSVTPR